MTISYYVGRFAPSPSGPLHFGSLVAALGSYLEARTHHGKWFVRMEDVDAPRIMEGAAQTILRQLQRSGFEWDGEILWQSTRQEAYRAALEMLIAKKIAYPCSCTRREIADSALARGGEHRYPGTCRQGLMQGKQPRAWRMRTEAGDICFTDALQGEVCEDVWCETGDFVLRRADGLFAYQLAVVVDDALQGITHIVRGADLLDSTARQIFLQRALGVSTPMYAHLPIVTHPAGEKLSKQTRAQPFDDKHPLPALFQALSLLGQNPPLELLGAPLNVFWEWAFAHWSLQKIPRCKTLRLP